MISPAPANRRADDVVSSSTHPRSPSTIARWSAYACTLNGSLVLGTLVVYGVRLHVRRRALARREASGDEPR